MMAPRRLVVVLRAEKWLKPKRRGTEADATGEEESGTELDALERYVAAPEPQTTLVLVAADGDKGRRLTKALYKQAAVVEAWGLKSDREFRSGDLGAIVQKAQGWIQREAKGADRTIDPDAARLIAERAGADMGRLRADVERLLAFAGDRKRITREDAEEVVSDKTSQDRWAVANAIERGDTATALRELALALDAGVVPYLMLGQLAWVARDRLARQNPGAVRAAVNAVFRTDTDIKTSGGDSRVLLERLVVELCGSTRKRF
jgi:DNA polymerase-3 subunit delta